MAIPLRKVEQVDGVDKAKVEEALWKLSQQLELLDATYKSRVDYEVWKVFQEEQHEIRKAEAAIFHVLRYK